MKISIIIATYNAEKTFQQAIQSVINQNYLQKELIIIDGQSTDGTIDIIKKYEQDITYWSSELDAGVYDAMNKGISKATGDVIAFLNSDDWYENNAFEQVGAYFEQNEIDVLIGNVNYVIKNHVFQQKSVLSNPEDIKIKMIYCHQGMFVRREVFEKVGKFNLDYKIVADYEWTLKTYLQGYRFRCVENIFANYRCDGLSSIQVYKLAKEERDVACLYASDSNTLLRIKEHYDNRRDPMETTLYNLVWKYQPQFVRGICEENDSYYIWGAGNCGKQCCILFWAADLQINAFIDNNHEKDDYMGYPVISSDRLIGDEKICIASELYEAEIKQQMLDMGYLEENIICYSMLKRQMVEYGKINYRDMVLK